MAPGPGKEDPVFELLAAAAHARSEPEIREALLEVQRAALQRTPGSEIVDEVICSTPKAVSWEAGLCDAVADNFRCVAYVTEVTRPGDWSWVDLHHVLGAREDVATVAAVFVIAREAALRVQTSDRDDLVGRLVEALSAQATEVALDVSPPEPVVAAARRLGVLPL
jgi:hypothetical protein